MRTIITPFSKEEEKRVKEIAEASKLAKNVDIVEDVYGFMKKPEMVDKGDMVDSLISEFAEGKFEYYLAMKKKVEGRLAFFNRILNHPYYQKFQTLPPEKSSMILLEMLNAFIKDKKEPKGEPGADPERDEAMKEFESIIHFGKELFDLLDDEFFQQLMQQRQIPTGQGTNDKPEDLPKNIQRVMKEMQLEIEIYELSKRLEFTIRTSKKGKFNEVQFPDNGLDVKKITKTRDITKAFPAQLALDDILFYKKLTSKELLMKKYMQRQEKKQILYMVVDRSGSMGSQVFQNRMTKIDVCKAIAIALMKKMIDNKDLFYFRWFDDRCGQLHCIKTKKQALEFIKTLIYGQNAGGGTNIQYAIEVAVKDIKGKTIEKWDEADILLVSDGEAGIDIPYTNKMLEGIDLHTIQIVERDYDPNDEYMSQCVQISKNFLMTQCNKKTDAIEIANLFSR